MQEYKFTYGRWGIDTKNFLTDIVTGKHCVGKLYKKSLQDLAVDYIEIKLPKNIDDFYIDFQKEIYGQRKVQQTLGLEL